MKKMPYILFIFLFSVGLATNATAQITITSTNFALSATAKDSATTKWVTKTGAVLPTHGSNQTWDYSAFRDTLPNFYYYLGLNKQPVSTRPTAFASATLEAFNTYPIQPPPATIAARIYYVNNTTGYGTLGDSLLFTRVSLQTLTGNAADSITYPGQSRILGATSYTYKFPMTDKSSWASTNKYATNLFLKIGAAGLNNAPGQQVRTTFLKDTIVGWGTLKLRNPANNGIPLNFNVLLNYHTFISVDSFFLNGQPASPALMAAFGLTQGVRDTSSFYAFIGSNFKAPHLRIFVDKRGTSITNMYRAILPDLGLTSKNKELTDITVKSAVFPNPTTEGITFEFDKKTSADWNIVIYNEVGQITDSHRVSAPQGTATLKVNLDKNRPNGTYFYNIVDENSLIRANGQFVKN